MAPDALSAGQVAAASRATVLKSAFTTLAMIIFVTLIATLQWQSLFPGERDFQVLSPLPIPRSPPE